MYALYKSVVLSSEPYFGFWFVFFFSLYIRSMVPLLVFVFFGRFCFTFPIHFIHKSFRVCFFFVLPWMIGKISVEIYQWPSHNVYEVFLWFQWTLRVLRNNSIDSQLIFVTKEILGGGIFFVEKSEKNA